MWKLGIAALVLAVGCGGQSAQRQPTARAHVAPRCAAPPETKDVAACARANVLLDPWIESQAATLDAFYALPAERQAAVMQEQAAIWRAILSDAENLPPIRTAKPSDSSDQPDIAYLKDGLVLVQVGEFCSDYVFTARQAALETVRECEAERMEERHRRMQAEESERERRRRIGAALAAGLSGVGAAMQNAASASPGYSPAAPYSPVAPAFTAQRPAESYQAGCTSDFACGYGSKCVKPNYSSMGTCMQAVDSVGAPTFEGPRTDSIGPKLPGKSDCKFNTDCAVGFRCNSDSGACVR